MARGFFNTYVSCRSRVVERLLPRGLAFLNAQYREFARGDQWEGHGFGGEAVRPTPADPSGRDCTSSRATAWAGPWRRLFAYDLACRFPHYNPVLVTFGSPPVGNIDFAIDFSKVMVKHNEYHPQTRYLRSIRVVAQTGDGKLDYVSALPVAPAQLHTRQLARARPQLGRQPMGCPQHTGTPTSLP